MHIKQYYSSISKRKFLTTVISSRGCPYNCLFCFTKGRKFRERSPENVMAEIKECMKLGITEFEFFDDTFTVNPKRVMDISNLIIKEKLLSALIVTTLGFLFFLYGRIIDIFIANPIFFGLYSTKLMILNTIYVIGFLCSFGLFLYLLIKKWIYSFN